jgi:hypothetical protein
VGGFELQRARFARQRVSYSLLTVGGFKLQRALKARAKRARARSAQRCFIRGFVVQALLFCQGVFVVRV